MAHILIHILICTYIHQIGAIRSTLEEGRIGGGKVHHVCPAPRVAQFTQNSDLNLNTHFCIYKVRQSDM